MTTVTDLTRLIPLTARTILDAGRGTGALGVAYWRLNPGARLLALDAGSGNIERARPHHDGCAIFEVERGDSTFETPDFIDWPDFIDCIVYDGVLEHLTDPIARIHRHAARLAPDGTILIRLSNAEHWPLTERWLRGLSGHENRSLNRINLATLISGLEAAGLSIVDVRAIHTGEANGSHFIAAMRPALDALGISPEAFAARALPAGFILRVRKGPVRPLVVAANLLAPVGGVSHLRVLHPIAALASEPEVTTHLAPPHAPPDPGPGGDDVPRIFILHRPALYGSEGQSVINGLIARGWLVITEFDDHPDFMRGLDNPALVTFRGVHAVQTSTPELAGVLRQKNPETTMFPNGIATLPVINNFTDPGVLTVFFGALNREPDWKPLMGAINDVVARAGHRLRFQVVHDEGFFHALDTRNKNFTPLCDYDSYMDLLGRSEVSLMPLDDTPFNRAKSDLKFIEAGACRVAALASPVVYRDSIIHGETGLVFESPEDFHRQFLRLTAIPDLALDLGNNARRAVIRDRMLAGQVAPRIAWYRDLWSRRQALTEALRSRIGGLPMPTAPWDR